MWKAHHMRCFLSALVLSIATEAPLHAQLKTVVYDFEGLPAGLTDLPEGDYKFGDLTYQAAANPLQASDMLGDGVLKIDINWSVNYGAFGRGTTRYLELDPATDFLNFYFYNPSQQSAELVISIADDDDNSLAYEPTNDDSWKKPFTISTNSAWQLVSVPLKDFTDGNSGGNGTFDIGWSPSKGMLLLVEFRFNKPSGASANATFYMDMISFSEGALPTGASPLSLPAKSASDFCRLGAHQNEAPGDYYLIPQHFEGMFPTLPERRLKYVNTYLQWGTNGSATAHALPGLGYQTLLDNGYTPIITWEPHFKGYSPLDAVQPKLSNITNGDYDAYIDAFADKVKTYSGTLIIRPMHEFDGDWYAWCISQNGQDPQKFVQAYRHIVDRFKAKNVTNVLWMWCPNSDPVPHRYWNWIVSAYPGDNYVDLVATDVYNSHYPSSLPWWRSFRWQTAETYYYFTKYFPSKPIVICELACRERFSSEPASLQGKAEWWAAMDRELQSEFRKIRGVVFFSETKDQTWAINTSTGSMNSLRDNIWYDDYYFIGPATGLRENTAAQKEFRLFPNPGTGRFRIGGSSLKSMLIYSATGSYLMRATVYENEIDLSGLPDGIYLVESDSNGSRHTERLILSRQ
jgi:hypothetical protein